MRAKAWRLVRRLRGNFLAAADGFYMDSLTFKASLDNDVVLPSVGDILTFGKYTYNGTTYNLDWRVLSVDIDNKRALLITEHIIDKMQYHVSSNAWEGSTVRDWLKTGFLTNANFTDEEQARILSVDISNKDQKTLDDERRIKDWERIITAWGSGEDKMFLLSMNEAETAPYFVEDGSRRGCTELLDGTTFSSE